MEEEDMARLDYDVFDFTFGKMESLHQLVPEPREQVTKVKALLDINKFLVCLLKVV